MAQLVPCATLTSMQRLGHLDPSNPSPDVRTHASMIIISIIRS
jgi:hypothetical protein